MSDKSLHPEWGTSGALKLSGNSSVGTQGSCWNFALLSKQNWYGINSNCLVRQTAVSVFAVVQHGCSKLSWVGFDLRVNVLHSTEQTNWFSIQPSDFSVIPRSWRQYAEMVSKHLHLPLLVGYAAVSDVYRSVKANRQRYYILYTRFRWTS